MLVSTGDSLRALPAPISAPNRPTLGFFSAPRLHLGEYPRSNPGPFRRNRNHAPDVATPLRGSGHARLSRATSSPIANRRISLRALGAHPCPPGSSSLRSLPAWDYVGRSLRSLRHARPGFAVPPPHSPRRLRRSAHTTGLGCVAPRSACGDGTAPLAGGPRTRALSALSSHRAPARAAAVRPWAGPSLTRLRVGVTARPCSLGRSPPARGRAPPHPGGAGSPFGSRRLVALLP